MDYLYRTKHVVQSAILLSYFVRLSACLSVCIGWVSSEVITRIIRLGLRFSDSQRRQPSPRETSPKFRWNRSDVAILSRKPAISLKGGKIGPRLLLMTNRKLHTRFRLVPKSTTLDDLNRPLPTLFHSKVFFREHHENLNEDRPVSSAAEMLSNLVSDNVRFMRMFARIP